MFCLGIRIPFDKNLEIHGIVIEHKIVKLLHNISAIETPILIIDYSDMLPETGDWIGHQTTMSSNNVPGSYVTNVTVSSMCLCCTGQQARRCSVNIGE